MCTECHVTDYEKRYRPESDDYASRWSELGVGCEACHGPGSRHVAWARAAAAGATAPGDAQDLGLTLRLGGARRFRFAAGAAIAQRDPPAGAPLEVETCAPCHARRTTLAGGWRPGAPFLDHYRPALLEEGLYHADGQIQDEVYEYGSFLQSRMFAAGVTCSDCHEPHSSRVDADAVCATCHRDAVFATPAHHHHDAGSEGARCVSCHMPTRSYMQIDARRDHSFRVPRPDLSLAIGTPNACGACHAEQGAAWAAQAVARWRGGAAPPTPHFGVALDAGRRGLPGASRALVELASDATRPAIVRATALSLLPAGPEPAALALLEGAVRDGEPLLRLAATEAAQRWPAEPRRRLAAPGLRDPLRAVRIEAARVLASLPESARAALGADFTRALAEYRAALAHSADRPESRVAAGWLELQLGDPERARSAYESALRIEPRFIPASINLADLHRSLGREAEALAVLRRALEREPASAELHHALGLALVRAGQGPEALTHLERAATAAPEQARFAYVHAIAVHAAGDAPRAIALLETAVARHPGDRDLRVALADLAARAGRRELAERQLRELAAGWPGDPEVAALRAALESDARGLNKRD
jgi:Flp pilus assembly protein TadD